MPHTRPTFSLIVPTRRRVDSLRRLLDSLAATAARPAEVEVVLVIDSDDSPSREVRHATLPLVHVVVPPGQPMGALNGAGYRAARGEYLMLLNDDVVARTPRWDDLVLKRLRRFPDGVVLVHVNDTLLREHLCTFPLVSRRFCEIASGVCPPEYLRYRIDDHVEDVFNLLAFLGHRRTFYLPDVVFEHLNAIAVPGAPREYHSDPDILALDAPRFLELFGARKELALRLLAQIEGPPSAARLARLRRLLEGVTDPFALRVRRRLRVESDLPLGCRLARGLRHQARQFAEACTRGMACWRQKGLSGLARAAARRLGWRPRELPGPHPRAVTGLALSPSSLPPAASPPRRGSS